MTETDAERKKRLNALKRRYEKVCEQIEQLNEEAFRMEQDLAYELQEEKS